MKLWKIITPLTICLVLVMLILPATASAASEGTCGENVTWTLDDAGTLTISGTGPMADYKHATPPWYDVRQTIKSIIIEDGVTYVGNWSFINMRILSSVSVGKDVTEIGEFAFSCSELSTVSLPEGLAVIGENAFEYCEMLEQVTIPNSVTTIESGAFSGCYSLAEVTIGSGVTAIGDFAFAECAISDVYYRGTEESWENITIGSYNEGLLAATLHYVKALPGDLDGDEAVTTDDAVHLLLAVMFDTGDYPVPDGTNLDFNGDSKVDTNDAVYLLLHTMFGAEDYPLSA